MVSIIILSYNTEALLYACLDSLYSHLKDVVFEVIVVDNNSQDESVHMVKKEFKKVILIENKENVGFAKGCNQAAKKAHGEYLLFLNSDTQMETDSLQKAIAQLQENEGVAILGGFLDNTDGTTSHSYGNFFTLGSTFALLFGGKLNKDHQVQKKQFVDWVSGGCMLIKRQVFEIAHGFDERFFMYIEDMELCYRIKKMGYSTLYYPEFFVTHKAQGSSNRSFAVLEIYKGILYFYKKHMSKLDYFAVRILLGIKAILVLVISIITLDNKKMETYGRALRLAL